MPMDGDPGDGASSRQSTETPSTTAASPIDRGLSPRLLDPNRRQQLLERSREKLRAHRSQLMTTEAELRELQNRVVEAEAAAVHAEDRAQLYLEFQRCDETLRDASRGADITELEARRETLSLQADEAVRVADEAAETVQRQSAELADLEVALRQALSALDETEQRRSELEARTSELREFENTLQHKWGELRQARDLADRAAVESAQMTKAIDVIRSETEAAIASEAALNEELSATSIALQEAQRRVESCWLKLTNARHDAERNESSMRSREAFEVRVAKDRRSKLQAEFDKTKVAVLTVESELHAINQQQRQLHLVDELESLTDCILRYRLDISRLRQELALRPPADQVAARVSQLQEQIVKLSREHARHMDDLDMLGRGEEGQRVLASRCEDLRGRLHHLETVQVQEEARRNQRLRTALHDAKTSVALWVGDELPRHEAFEARLTTERDELQRRLRSLQHAKSESIAALETQRDELVQKVRGARGELRRLQPDPHVAVPIDTTDGTAAAASIVVVDMEPASPTRDTVEVEVVEHDFLRTSDADSAATRTTRQPMRRAPKPVLYTADVAGHEDRQFNFFAVAMMKSVIGLFRRRNAPPPAPRLPPVAV
jgi:chromosome segregation ATPase